MDRQPLFSRIWWYEIYLEIKVIMYKGIDNRTNPKFRLLTIFWLFVWIYRFLFPKAAQN